MKPYSHFPLILDGFGCSVDNGQFSNDKKSSNVCQLIPWQVWYRNYGLDIQ